MGLSRLENFLKNVRGNILYVSPNDLDATDSIENKGNSLTRPFKTIQRALIESARFSYQSGLNNDRFAQTTILLYPGDHIIDNRPGYIPDGSGNFRTRFGSTTSDFSAWDLTTNYELANVNNALYKLNSVHGGVIIPRGTSLVGLDLRKTKIRPKFVPNPLNDTVQNSAIFRVTGASYFWQFSIFDADPNGVVYLDYTENSYKPNFSHHKLTAFEYADGVNKVRINDTYQVYGSNTRTDLDMYYEKVGLVYGVTSGRQIEPDYPSTGLDIQAKIDEFRITGPKTGSVGISSIKAGDGETSSNLITVTTSSALSGVDVDTAIVIDGITATGYDGQHVVTDKVSDTVFKYNVQNSPSNALPSVSGSTVALTIDTVTSASPYIFNISLRSVFGMNGLLADGSKASGFASMMVAQFTGIGLQKDNNAFLKYNATTGVYDDGTVSGNESLNTDSRAIYKPSYSGSHIKAINGATIQAASVFAIGYAEHFLSGTGSEMSITNSNSNFGAKALVAEGFKKNAFSQDDVGYISHIIPPKEFSTLDKTVEFQTLDIATTVGVGTTSERLYLKDQTNPSIKPENVLDGYRIGAGTSDRLNVLLPISAGITSEFSSRIVMQGHQTSDGIPKAHSSGEKSFNVNRSAAGINSITSNQIELIEAHTFLNGESIRIISEDGSLPDGIESNQVYFAITSGISTNIGLKIAKTLSDAENTSALTINNLGGRLKIVSRVSDKNSGDIGHPIQFDDTVKNQWFINVGIDTHNVGTAKSDAKDRIYTYFVNQTTAGLGNASPRAYIRRKSDERKQDDTTYRLRYVIPAATGVAVARPPKTGYILQESNTSIGSTTAEVQTYFGSENFTNVAQQRNFSFIAQANYFTGIATFVTEQPHKLSVGSLVETVNVKSANNSTGLGNSGFNGSFRVTGITSERGFTVGMSTDPGTFTVIDTITRDTTLPHFKRKEYNSTYYIQDTEEIQEYISGTQDGIYYLTVLNSSVSPTVSPFTGQKFTQPIKYLYPQVNRDNPVADPESAKSHALSRTIGETTINDVRKSLTKETLDSFILDQGIGIGVTNIITSVGSTLNGTKIPAGTFQYPLSKAHTIFTDIDHGLNGIQKVSIASSGFGYGTGGATDEIYYNAQLVNSEELPVPTFNSDGNENAVGIGSTTGKFATAKVTVDKNKGGITAITIMNAGSAFGIGNTMYISGIGTHTSSVGSGYSAAKITVTKIESNIGDTIRISGVSSESYKQYNDLYRIQSVAVGAAKSFSVIGNTPVTGVTTAGIGTVLAQNAGFVLTGKSIGISTFTYDVATGVATVGTSTYHGLGVNSKVRVAISTVGVRTDGHTIDDVPDRERGAFTGSFTVVKNSGDQKFEINLGIGVTTTVNLATGYSQSTLTSPIFVMPQGFASNDGSPTVEDESLSGRMVSIYDGVQTYLETAMTKTTTEMSPVGLGLTNQIGVKIGDYYQIDDEIVRVKNNPHPHSSDSDPSGPLTVYRAVLGTRAAAHVVKSVVRKIKPIPVELRRQSINRATGHTFEYLGFGPGNYSTSLPERQDRNLSEAEELIGQSLRKNGGVNYFSGTNDKGILFAGNKKLDPITGKEEIHSTPIRTVTGEDISVKKGINIVKATEGEFSSSINVTGGDGNKSISEFKGPVVFNNKVTSTSTKGIEASSLFLQGDATVSRKYTVGISTPTSAGTAGDVSFNNNPQGGKYLGWVYTTDNAWKRFGSISTATNFDYHTFDSVTSPIFNPTGIVTARFESNVSMGASLGVGTVFSRGAVDFGSAGSVTERFAIMPRVTTTERNALAGIQTGSIIYNLTTSKFQGYASGAWVDLH